MSPDFSPVACHRPGGALRDRRTTFRRRQDEAPERRVSAGTARSSAGNGSGRLRCGGPTCRSALHAGRVWSRRRQGAWWPPWSSKLVSGAPRRWRVRFPSASATRPAIVSARIEAVLEGMKPSELRSSVLAPGSAKWPPDSSSRLRRELRRPRQLAPVERRTAHAAAGGCAGAAAVKVVYDRAAIVSMEGAGDLAGRSAAHPCHRIRRCCCLPSLVMGCGWCSACSRPG